MLPDEIPAEEKQELSESPLTTYIGELDDPAKQEQYPLFLDLETCGHILVCGEPGKQEKSSFSEALLYSLVKKTAPEQLSSMQLVIQSRLLKVFRNLPHCGAVLEEDDAEQSPELFRLLTRSFRRGKSCFPDWK